MHISKVVIWGKAGSEEEELDSAFLAVCVCLSFRRDMTLFLQTLLIFSLQAYHLTQLDDDPVSSVCSGIAGDSGL